VGKWREREREKHEKGIQIYVLKMRSLKILICGSLRKKSWISMLKRKLLTFR